MLGFIGAGNMGGAIVRGVIRADLAEASDIYISCGNAAESEEVAAAVGARACASNTELVQALGEGGILILAVKPNIVPSVLDEISRMCADLGTLIVSVAAGLSLDTLASHLGEGQAIVRTMPNMAATIGQSMTALCPNAHVSAEQFGEVEAIFKAVGQTARIAEKDFSAYSAIAGCSPAFTFYYIDALARGAVQAGMKKDEAVAIAAQAVRGAAQMLLESLEDGATPASLADAVQSPGGTTVAGVVAMDEAGFSATVVRGVRAAIKRDHELG
ncbi:MAG: pyrroline-5-carboxylate reductase [Actinomycetaceae bacterium]|nr:pyrroline-5-carboxylate reductase [Actinomycetaceae bacterium]